MDIKRVDGVFRLFAKGGRENTGIDALQWAVDGVNSGAGELVVNSIDTDGVKGGFDLELLDAIAARVNVPIIASGGAGKMEDFSELFSHEGIDAGLAASIFHYKEIRIEDLKKYLRDQGVEVQSLETGGKAMDFEKIRFDEKGLVPAVVQDYFTKEVLTVAYMNRESLEITVKEGYTCFLQQKPAGTLEKGRDKRQ